MTLLPSCVFGCYNKSYTSLGGFNLFFNYPAIPAPPSAIIAALNKSPSPLNAAYPYCPSAIKSRVFANPCSFAKLYAPSKVINPISNRTTYEMTKEDILRIEDDFVKASIRAKKAGFDGIEIHGAHFYLVSEFLSPIFNKRTDEYGGNDENRARFLVEIIEKIRKAVGNDFIISVKINCDDGFPGGISEEGFILACKLAEKAGVDMIQVSGMGWFKIKAKDAPALFFERASKVAEVLNIPVILIGNIRDVETAQNILNKSNIEYVGIARPLICEVDLVQKWTNGDFKKSKCVSCNSCLNKYSTCVFNKGKRLYP